MVKFNYKNNIKLYDIKVWQKAIDIFRKIKQSLVMAFDVRTATSIVLPYDGSPEQLDAFVDSVY